MAVFSSQAFGQYHQQNQIRGYQNQAYQQLVQPGTTWYNLYSAVANLDPELMSEMTDLLLKTVRRTNDLIDNLPASSDMAAQMADLWAIAYPQLKTLLTKAGAWVNQVQVPAA